MMQMLWSEHNVLRTNAVNNDSQPGPFGTPVRGHLAMSGGMFNCHAWAWGGLYWHLVRPGMQLNILQCTGLQLNWDDVTEINLIG